MVGGGLPDRSRQRRSRATRQLERAVLDRAGLEQIADQPLGTLRRALDRAEIALCFGPCTLRATLRTARLIAWSGPRRSCETTASTSSRARAAWVAADERTRGLGLGATDPDREANAQREPAWRQIALGKEVGDAGIDGGLQQLLVLLAGHEHDRRVIRRARELLRELDARGAGQVVIEQQAVEALRSRASASASSPSPASSISATSPLCSIARRIARRSTRSSSIINRRTVVMLPRIRERRRCELGDRPVRCASRP